jgi:hypothetical protein
LGPVSAIALCITALTAQQPARDRSAAPPSPTGTARIAGIVVDAATPPQPLRRVIVTLTGGDGAAARTTISDDEGRFVFEGLAAGRYLLSGTKPAYLRGSHGSIRPGRPGIPLRIADGERVADVRLTLARGAAVMGTLHDEAGEPAPNQPVHAFRIPPANEPPLLLLSGSAMTDDRGVYRIFGLPPGDYLVGSAIRMNQARDIEALSAAQIDDAFRELRARAGLRDEAAPVSPGNPRDVTPGTYAYAPTYFPGVAAATVAERVRLGVGDERTGIDFPIRMTRMATIEGVVRAADGSTPAATQFVINPEGLQLRSLISAVPTFSSQATANGRAFKYTSVAPGRYRIAVQSTQGGVAYASTIVEVAGADVSGLSLVLQPALRLSGGIAFDATTAGPLPSAASVRISLRSANGLGSSSSGTTRMGNFSVAPVIGRSDGTFELTGIMPDVYELSATVTGASGWWLRSAMVNGRDLLDHPLEIADDIGGAVLTFTDRRATLSGRLTTAAGVGAAAYFVAVFPADRTLWRPGARRIRLVRADTDGTWTVPDLPGGDYLIAALSDVDAADLLEMPFLETLAASAVRITLAEGEEKRQDLRIGR